MTRHTISNTNNIFPRNRKIFKVIQCSKFHNVCRIFKIGISRSHSWNFFFSFLQVISQDYRELFFLTVLFENWGQTRNHAKALNLAIVWVFISSGVKVNNIALKWKISEIYTLTDFIKETGYLKNFQNINFFV